MIKNKLFSSFLFSLLISYSTISAAPWLPTGDLWLRADIEYLSDQGIIRFPITTWPIMWSGIKKDLDRELHSDNLIKLSQRERDTLIRLKRAFRRATKKSSSVTFKFASDGEVLRGFADTPREEAELEFSRSDMGASWAYQLNVQYIYNPYIPELQEEEDTRLDGSFLAGIYENFSIGYGYVDKWWGPGWDSSLILSNNARSTPGIMLQRNYSDAFESEWLSWIGPWTLNIFANTLNDTRQITDANLLGLSITFKPFDSLEIGLRRTAQWGGEGRPHDFTSLINLALGRGDNCFTANCVDDEPGNQLATVDFRWRLPFDYPMAMYFQLMGEDEASYFPSKKTYLFGFSSYFSLWQTPIKYYVEYSDTSTNSGAQFNVTYNHHLYQTGYRYYGRSLGSTYDNDTESFVIGTIFSLSPEQKVFIQISNTDMNMDDRGRHTISRSNVDFNQVSALYRQQMKYGQLELYLNQFSEIIDENLRQDNETRIGASWKMTFN